MTSWRELKVPVIPATHLLEDHIISQIIAIGGGIADKTEDHIERSHQTGKRLETKC